MPRALVGESGVYGAVAQSRPADRPAAEIRRRAWPRLLTDYRVDLLVTLAVMLDWLPGYLRFEVAMGGDDGGAGGFSATRVIALPLILYDMARSPSRYSGAGFGWVFIGVGLLYGAGIGLAAGKVTLQRLVSLMACALVFLFFARRRSEEERGRIVSVAITGATATMLVTVLASFGLAPAGYWIATGDYTRVLAGTTWSSVGLFAVLPFAALGGVLLQPSGRLRPSFWTLAVVAMAVSAYGAFLTGQRTAAAAVGISLALAVLAFMGDRRHSVRGARTRRGRATRLLQGLGLIAATLLLATTEPAQRTMSSAFYRMQNVDEGGGLGARAYRMMQYSVFVGDLWAHRSLIPLGRDSFIDRTGNVPHVIFAEAFYDGGYILFWVFGIGYVMTVGRLFALQLTGRATAVSTVLLISLLGFTVHLVLHPGLNIRLVYLVLGLATASASATRRQSAPLNLRLVR